MTSTGLAAIEAFFGAGVTVAPMPGAIGGLDATLFRHLPAMQDDWSGGLHLEGEPDEDQLAQALSTWQAFEAPGRLRWPAPAGAIGQGVLEAVASAGFVVTPRPILMGALDVGAAPVAAPAGVTIGPIEGDIRDWAGFEVLARWVDLDVDPDRWRWRAKRVRHLVEGGRGRAWLARTPAAPVGAVVVLDPPDHRHGHAPTVGVVVHQAHRGQGIAASLVTTAAAAVGGPVTVLGQASGAPLGKSVATGLLHVETLVEVRRAPDVASRKA